jgi:hypothetical protein
MDRDCSCCAGAADGSVKVWDRRALGGALHTFALHASPIMRVEWAPYRKGARFACMQPQHF